MQGTDFNSRLVLPNNLYSLLASQAFTNELGKKARLDAVDRARICLGLEEAILNVITHSFGAEEKVMYEIAFRITDSVFSIIVRDDGKQFGYADGNPPEDLTKRDIDTYPASGLGFQIMRNSFDQVMVRNYPDGKELHLIKYLPLPNDGQADAEPDMGGD